MTEKTSINIVKNPYLNAGIKIGIAYILQNFVKPKINEGVNVLIPNSDFEDRTYFSKNPKITIKDRIKLLGSLAKNATLEVLFSTVFWVTVYCYSKDDSELPKAYLMKLMLGNIGLKMFSKSLTSLTAEYLYSDKKIYTALDINKEDMHERYNKILPTIFVAMELIIELIAKNYLKNYFEITRICLYPHHIELFTDSKNSLLNWAIKLLLY